MKILSMMIFILMSGFLASCSSIAEAVIEGMIGSATGSAFDSDRDERPGWRDERLIGGEKLRDYKSEDRVKISR
jgi:hypothetical protein